MYDVSLAALHTCLLAARASAGGCAVQIWQWRRLSLRLSSASQEMFARVRQLEASGEGLYRFFLLSFLTLDRSWAAGLLFSGSVQVLGAAMLGALFRRRLEVSPPVTLGGRARSRFKTKRKQLDAAVFSKKAED